MRELRNIIERAITLSDDETIDLAHLQTAPLRSPILAPAASLSAPEDVEYVQQSPSSTMSSKKASSRRVGTLFRKY